jgi:hypothetical protein
VYNEFERMWEKEVAGYLKVLFCHSPEHTKEHHGNTQLAYMIPWQRSELDTSRIQVSHITTELNFSLLL